MVVVQEDDGDDDNNDDDDEHHLECHVIFNYKNNFRVHNKLCLNDIEAMLSEEI